MLNWKKIKPLREKLGLTLDQAAKQAGLSGRSAWHDIESGRRANVTLKTLDAIAQVLKVDAKELLK